MKAIKSKINKVSKVFVATGMLAIASYSGMAFSQQVAIACPGYELPKTKLLGERSGKRLNAAYEVYLNEELDEKVRAAQAIEMLKEINPKEPFDKAMIERFLGQLLISEDGKEKEALALLETAAGREALNDKEQAETLKLVADLSMQEDKSENAIKWYTKWMDFTCMQDGDTWTKMAKAYVDLKRYDDTLKAADNAIANYEEPNKNPYALKIAAYHETKNYKGAVSVAEILVELFPTEQAWWSQLGFFYMLIEDFPKALSTFELAHKQGFLSKKNEIRALVQLYAQNEVPIKSATLHKKYMDSGLLDSEATDFSQVANTLLQAREYKDAAKYFGQAGDKVSDPEHFRKQGVMLMQVEDYRGAISALTKALNAGAEPGKTHYSLMEANFYAGDFRQANVHATEALKDPSLRRTTRAWVPYIKQKADNRGIKI
jgi:Flp pilus assembly protein TadD